MTFSRRPGARFNRGRVATVVAASGGDVTAPTLSSAAINAAGSTLTLTYNESLDAGSVPALGDFTLAGDAISALTGTPGVSGSAVTLTITPPVGSDEVGITISYTPGVNPIQDAAGNDAAALVAQAVTNNSTYVQTPADIFGANLVERWKSTNGITIGTGVSSWLGMVAATDFAQATGANQPAYSASGGPNNKPYLTLDGSNDSLAATLVRAAPGTTPAIIWQVARQISWTANDPLMNDAASTMITRQVGASPQLVIFAGGTNRATNGGALLSTWARIQAEFRNSVGTADRLLCIATDAAAAATSGNTAGTGPLLGRNSGSTAFGNFDTTEICLIKVTPTATQDSRMNVYCTAEYGAGLV